MKRVAYEEIMSFLYLPKSVNNVFLVNGLIKTVYAPEDKYDYLSYLPKITAVKQARLKVYMISSLPHPGTLSTQYTDGVPHKGAH